MYIHTHINRGTEGCIETKWGGDYCTDSFWYCKPRIDFQDEDYFFI